MTSTGNSSKDQYFVNKLLLSVSNLIGAVGFLFVTVVFGLLTASFVNSEGYGAEAILFLVPASLQFLPLYLVLKEKKKKKKKAKGSANDQRLPGLLTLGIFFGSLSVLAAAWILDTFEKSELWASFCLIIATIDVIAVMFVVWLLCGTRENTKKYNALVNEMYEHPFQILVFFLGSFLCVMFVLGLTQSFQPTSAVPDSNSPSLSSHSPQSDSGKDVARPTADSKSDTNRRSVFVRFYFDKSLTKYPPANIDKESLSYREKVKILNRSWCNKKAEEKLREFAKSIKGSVERLHLVIKGASSQRSARKDVGGVCKDGNDACARGRMQSIRRYLSSNVFPDYPNKEIESEVVVQERGINRDHHCTPEVGRDGINEWRSVDVTITSRGPTLEVTRHNALLHQIDEMKQDIAARLDKFQEADTVSRPRRILTNMDRAMGTHVELAPSGFTSLVGIATSFYQIIFVVILIASLVTTSINQKKTDRDDPDQGSGPASGGAETNVSAVKEPPGEQNASD